MPLSVFDYREDVRNLVVAPEIRARIMLLQPGEDVFLHSHQDAPEMFAVFEGHCEFEIEGEKAVLGPGQLLFCPAGQRHRLKVVGDDPVYLYLSVTPHHEPTHTTYAPDGTPQPQYGLWRDSRDLPAAPESHA